MLRSLRVINVDKVFQQSSSSTYLKQIIQSFLLLHLVAASLKDIPMPAPSRLMVRLLSSGNPDLVCPRPQEGEPSPDELGDGAQVGRQEHLPDRIGQRRLLVLGHLEHLLQQQWPELLLEEGPDLLDALVEVEVVGHVPDGHDAQVVHGVSCLFATVVPCVVQEEVYGLLSC